MPTIERDDIRIHAEVTGSGPAVVLGHSFLCSGAMWAPQIGPLAEHHTVVNVDLRGHGRSGAVARPFTLYDLVEDVTAVLDALRIDRAVWAGLSIGGMVALRAALVVPERVSRLILLDTSAREETVRGRLVHRMLLAAAWVAGTRGAMPGIVPQLFCRQTRTTRPDLIREWRDRIASVPFASIRYTLAALHARDRIVERLGEIDVPALVVVGAEDVATPPVCSRQIAAGLPNGTYMEIENAGHLAGLEQPEAVNSAILSFLGRP